MKIAVIGASAGIGLESVKRALSRGHNVTGLSRSEVALDSKKSFTGIRGSATDKAALERSVAGADGILVTLGVGGRARA